MKPERRAIIQSAMLSLSIFGRHVAIDCADDHVYFLLSAGYGHMAASLSTDVHLRYTVGLCTEGRGFFIDRDGARLEADSVSDFLYFFEKDLTIELQRQRSDLYFIHAAALECDNIAAILVAPSGTGKSTTAYGLLHTGFRYLSDELAPIDLKRMTVHPYPHALCLKSEPPSPYHLPADTLHTETTLHVPVAALPALACDAPIALGTIFFLARDGNSDTTVQRIDTGEAAARLYANALNNLAHGGQGLDAAIHLTSQAPCFRLQLGELSQAGAVIRAALQAERSG